MRDLSKVVAQSVGELVKSCEALKGTHSLFNVHRYSNVFGDLPFHLWSNFVLQYHDLYVLCYGTEDSD